MNRAPAALLLAAGRGSRMGGSLPKPIVSLAGWPLLLHLTGSLREAGVTDITVVVGQGAERIEAALGPGLRYVLQDEPRGTADAVACARETLADRGELLVFVGDSPLVTPEAVGALVARHRETGAALSLLTATFPRAYPYARLFTGDDGRVQRSVEEVDATPEERRCRDFMTSHYLFTARHLWAHLDPIATHPVTGERQLTDVIGRLIAAGQRVEAVRVADYRQLVGINTVAELAWAEEVLRQRRAADTASTP